ncbi:Uncharacterised protein [uncultured archaeon]|nr:Uncharacterised protein [uncultured archaeon]
MVNKEILGGLRIALEKGESLKRAMTTLFNAGYKREEIEEAARALSEPVGEKGERAPDIALPAPLPSSNEKKHFFKKLSSPNAKPSQKIPGTVSKPKPAPLPKSKPIKPEPPKPVVQPPVQNGQPQVVQPVIIQRVSGYDEPQTIRDKIIIAVLITLLIILVGALAAIFLFQHQLINFFSNIFNQQT